MPIFFHRTKPVTVIVPHKCGFTSFRHSSDYMLHSMLPPSRRDYFRIAFGPRKVYRTFRSPTSRLISCFKDKFRLVPSWILENDFRWPYLNQVFLQHLGVDNEASDQEKAKICLSISFHDFLRHLPAIYQSDPHVWPQVRFSQCKITKNLLLSIPNCNNIQLERPSSITIPDFPNHTQKHSSSQVTEVCEFSDSALRLEAIS